VLDLDGILKKLYDMNIRKVTFLTANSKFIAMFQAPLASELLRDFYNV
jgi:hypothetical protein